MDDTLPPVLIGAKHTSALAELSFYDLKRLRVAARAALIRAGCPAEQATDKECDRYIEALLPVTAETMLKRVVDAKLA